MAAHDLSVMSGLQSVYSVPNLGVYMRIACREVWALRSMIISWAFGKLR